MRKFLKITGLLLLGILTLSVVAGVMMYRSAMRGNFGAPEAEVRLSDYPPVAWSDSVRTCGDAFLMLDADGLWEARVGGPAIERGAVLGMLSKDLLENQERVFVDQIRRMIPSERQVRFLHKLVAIFNRNIGRYIPREYQEEIYAMSLSCSHGFDAYGTPYGRQLNYHAAHDIGHTMQEYMLVGCSSFAVWGEESEDGGLLVGRNFDFYVGDEFAENKVVLFVEPEEGYRYASVTWPGMTGVVSGMNECGLTVTINAAKGALPTSSAMPISLLARHILQHAATIDEAFALAGSCRTFVSESLLIGSARDGRAAVIEKTPSETHLFAPDGTRVVCTNHYQSDAFAEDRYNVENMAQSDSRYRHERLSELIREQVPLNVMKSAAVLRDRHGKGGADIGLGNEKSINQFIAHHSVIFQPERRRMWVSTAPWQCGAYLCFDLDEAFGARATERRTVSLPQERIPADTSALRQDVPGVLAYRSMTAELQKAVDGKREVADDLLDRYVAGNPGHYHVYALAGDYRQMLGDTEAALTYWKTALEKEIPYQSERNKIEKKIKRYDKK